MKGKGRETDPQKRMEQKLKGFFLIFFGSGVNMNPRLFRRLSPHYL